MMSMGEMNGSVSRSGRVRKKSAKLIEMEESPLVEKVAHRTPPSRKKTSNTLPKLKIVIGGSMATENNDCSVSGISDGISHDGVVEDGIVDHFPMDDMVVEEEVATSMEEPQVLNNNIVHQSTPVPSLKMKFNVSKGTAEIESSPFVPHASPSTIQPTPPKRVKTSHHLHHEPESEVNKLFKQIESGIAPPPKKHSAKKNLNASYPATTFNHSSNDVQYSNLVNSHSTPKMISTGVEKGRKKKSSPQTNTIVMNDFVGGVEPSTPEKAEKEKKPFITGYGLWCKEMRPKVQLMHTELDFAAMNKKLAEIWNTTTSNNEKHHWKVKAEKMRTENEKQRTSVTSTSTSAGPGRPPKASTLFGLSSVTATSIPRVGPMTPIDVACYLKIVGESFSIIGRRLVEQRSEKVADRKSLQPLFDGLLCSLSSLITLTSLDPRLDGCPREKHLDTLYNVAYIMPGI